MVRKSRCSSQPVQTRANFDKSADAGAGRMEPDIPGQNSLEGTA